MFPGAAALVSYDGAHLTLDGARFVGARLRAHPVLAAALAAARP